MSHLRIVPRINPLEDGFDFFLVAGVEQGLIGVVVEATVLHHLPEVPFQGIWRVIIFEQHVHTLGQSYEHLEHRAFLLIQPHVRHVGVLPSEYLTELNTIQCAVDVVRDRHLERRLVHDLE